MRARLTTSVAIATALMLVAPAAQARTPYAADDRAEAGQDGRTTRAERALAQAEALFTPTSAKSGRATEPVDATMVLRDLARRLNALSGEDRAAARALLARPTGGGDPTGGLEHKYTVDPRHSCTKKFCLYWVDPQDAPSNKDRVPRASGDEAATPTWVAANIAAFKAVYRVQLGRLGFRKPKSDAKSPASKNKKFDIYLQDLPNGIYGYCTTDDPALNGTDRPKTVSAYCVLDNDMAEFSAPPEDSMRVTAAHEFFHAVQFNYDFWDDSWFMEGTAAWIEDEVFDSVDDNYQFLANSPLTRPQQSVDGGSNPYGNWIFWRFLAEYLAPAGGQARPGLIRQVWENAAKKGQYSIRAAPAMVQDQGKDFARAFTDFAVWNRHPGAHYAEGEGYAARGFTAPLARSETLSSANRTRGQQGFRLDHLASRTIRYTPGDGLSGDWDLRVQVDMPAKSRGSHAALTVRRTNGTTRTSYIKLNAKGNGSTQTRFSSSDIAFAELTLVNASTQYQCSRGTRFSCQGKPKDDNLKTTFKAGVRRG